MGEYATALLKGASLTPEERASVVEKLSRYTGISQEFIERTNLRINDQHYFKELLRERGIVLPPKMLYERFIYLPDSTHRRELMVIYAERLNSGDTTPIPKEKLDSLLAEHERRGLRSFAMVPQRR